MPEIPDSCFKRKKLRIKLLKGTKTYDINPARRYERDCEMVLRGLARFIEKSGFCPQAKFLARRRTWLLEGTNKYLEDLLAMGMVEIKFGQTWNLTAAGWEAIGVEPIEPTYPPELVSNAASIREAKYLMQRMRDPEVEAAFETLRARKQHEQKSASEA